MVKFRTLFLRIFMKKIFLTLLLAPLMLFAENIIGGIAVVVDDEVITIYEIKQEQDLSHNTVKEAVNQLIRLKLEHIEATKRHIKVTNQEVLDDMKKRAEQNSITLSQLYDALNSTKGLSEFQVKQRTKVKLLKEKIYNAIAMSEMEEPTDSEVEEFYELHLDDYRAPRSIDTVIYSSSSKKDLQVKVSNPMQHIPSVTTENVNLETAKTNPRLIDILIKTKDNHFSPILPQGKDRHMSFYIVRKNDMNTPPLALIRMQVENKIMENKREQILGEHFQRMRVNANIRVLRLPKE